MLRRVAQPRGFVKWRERYKRANDAPHAVPADGSEMNCPSG